jgi:hypothetical protein
MRLLLYTQYKTARTQYVFKQIFKYILGVDYFVTSDLQEFVSYNGPKLSYADTVIHQDLHFYADGLLWEKGIGFPDIELGFYKSQPVIFNHSHPGALNFDVFSATFFFLSRYEEYMAHRRDKHNRFPAKESFAYNNGVIDRPLVDEWAYCLLEKILEKYPDLEYKKRSFTCLNTLDIDSVYAIRSKGLVRTIGHLGKLAFKLRFQELFFALSVLIRRRKDPFDTFSILINRIKKYPKIKNKIFFLVGEYDTYDTNIHPKNRDFQSIIKSVGDYAKIGIHPSYRSNKKEEFLKEEINTLKNIIHRNIDSSRQHFLKLEVPTTYRRLIEQGITEDYTMGFASQIGFRAGTCTPFYFYDLDLEYETPLRLFPFCIMDASLRYYLNQSPVEAKASVDRMIESVKNVNGLFIPIWHNESLSENTVWKGWRSVYFHLLEKMNDELD